MDHWGKYIIDLLDIKSEDLSNFSFIIVQLFHGFIYPEITLISDSSKTIYVPEKYYIKVDGGSTIYKLLCNTEIFLSLPFDIKRGILDILFLILRRGIYDVIRLQCCNNSNDRNQNLTLFSHLLKLVDLTANSYESLCISKRALTLLGVIGAAGVTTFDIKESLFTLRYPSELTTSLLQSIHQMVKLDIALLKAYPIHIFNFGGFGSGIYSFKNTNLFTREYQFFTWFRVENFDRSIDQDDSLQHIFTMITTTSKGIDIFIEDRKLCMTIYHGKNEPIYKQFNDQILSRGVWYHLSIRHCKPRMALFSRDEFTINLDFQLLYQENIRYPSILNNELVDIICGKNFDGQMSPIYLLNESIPLNAVELLARQDACKTTDNIVQSVDLQNNIILSDKKNIPILSKVTTVYHPDRCVNEYALDIHNNCHGQLATKTSIWNITSFNDIINSIGGALCVLPLFPRLFIENEVKRFETLSNAQTNGVSGNNTPNVNGVSSGISGLGTSLGDINDDFNGIDYNILDNESMKSLQSERNDLKTDGCLTYLFLLLSRCLSSQKYHQRQLIQIGGIDMIEYALRYISPTILLSEGESCVLAILQLRSSVSHVSELDSAIIKRLLFNLEVWSKSSYQLQTSLMSVLIASMKAQPDDFLNLIGIQGLIDGMTSCYIDKKVIERKSIQKAQSNSPIPKRATDSEREFSFSNEVVKDLPIENRESLINSSPRLNSENSSMGLSNHNKSTRFNKSFKLTLNQEILNDIEIEESYINSNILSKNSSIIDDVDELSIKPDVDELIVDSNDFIIDTNITLETPVLENDVVEDSEFEDSELTLTSEQRKNLRECLETMILTLALHGSSENEIKPIIDYMSICKDSVVLFEFSQLLLCLIVEGNSSIMTSITSACRGPEEFAIFIIFHLIHQSSEDVRSIGIRILTHYYLRLDCIPTNALNLTLKRRKGSILSRAIDTLSSVGANSHSIQRLVICGGLTLLLDIVETHMKNSSELTYSALLEMLLTKPGSRSQISIKHTELFQSSVSNIQSDTIVNVPAVNTSLASSTTKLLSVATSLIPTLYNSSNVRSNNQTQRNDKNSFTQRSVVFAAHYLSPDQVHDEGTSMVNTPILPLFFQLIPLISVSIHDQIYSDLLALLKHSSGNRDAFCEHPLWHVCMYEMLSQLITPDNMYKIKRFELISNNMIPLLESVSTHSLKIFKEYQIISPELSNFSNEDSTDNQLDTIFDIGMKVYATLLLHSIDKRGGWRELQRTISQSYHTDMGYSIGQTVLSHVINDLSFNIKSKYRDLQKSTNSSNINDCNEAMNKLENTFSAILISSQYALIDLSCVNILLNKINYDIAKNRLQHYDFLYEELAIPVTVISNEQKQELSPTKSWLNPTPTSFDSTNNNKTSDGNDNSDYSYVKNKNLYNIQSTMTDESNMILDMTEKNLIRNLHEILKEEPDNTLVSNILNETHNVIDFNHIWTDLSNNLFQSLNNPIINNSKYLINREHTLHPLDREHNFINGRIVLILQTLRLFDVIFWPHDSLPIRNSQMLRFQSEKQDSTTNAINLDLKSNKRPDNTIAGMLSLYSGTMRMCLYVLSTLSPFTDLALLNVRRIKALIESSEKISSQSTPIQDWVICVQVHVTTILQKCISSFGVLFKYLNLNSPDILVTIVNSNFKNDNSIREYEIKQERQNIVNDEIRFEECLNDNDMINTLQNLFDNVTGKQLIQYIKCCILILISIYDTKKYYLISLMSEKSMFWLNHLIERAKADMQIPTASNETNNSTNNTRSFSISSADNSSNEIKKNWKLNQNISEDNNNKNSRLRAPSDIGIVALEFGGIARINLNDKYKTKAQSETVSETSSEFSERLDNDNNINLLSNNPKLLRNDNENIETSNNTDDQILARDVVTILLWLREPYFRCNLLKSIGVIKSIKSLENYEIICNKYYTNELDTMETILHDQKIASRKKVVNEIMELKELSGSVTSMMKSRESRRRTSYQTLETLRLKRVATSWQECIHLFEADWSPWYNNEYYDNPVVGKAYYELSRLKDTRMRRMILTPTLEPIDHSDAAYTESKIRDQQNYEKSQSQDNNTLENNITEISFLKSDLNKVILKREAELQISSWEEEDDLLLDDDNKQTPNLSLNANSNITSNNVTAAVVGATINHFFTSQNIERPLWTYTFDWNSDEKIQCIIDDVTFIQVENVILGSLLLTSKFLYFHPIKMTGSFLSYNNVNNNNTSTQCIYNDKRWSLDRLSEVYGRRYLLQNCAIELFFIDITEIYFAFTSLNQVRKFYNILKKQNLPLFTLHNTLNPKNIMKSVDQGQKYLDLWRKRLISNFEYLMYLNMIAGRSYNDITQYPVMPWVLCDYASEILDLNDPNVYRDLSKPVGALNQQRLKEFLDRYHTFDDMRDSEEIPKFMYGSHYSSAGVVLHYLIRQEPFTTMSINLQGGRFDCPDRIFFDISKTWLGCNNSMSDVKELIPELFCCPEILLNTNSLILGDLQDGGVVNDVVLPPWANHNVYEFIRVHREALESDYVSDHLNEWIDLIFGSKQRGQAAVDAYNVFYYLTYENAINIDAIEDPLQKEATKAQVIHFGQTPYQLFTKDHPRRLSRNECMVPLCADLSLLSSIITYIPPKQFDNGSEHGSIISIQCSSDKLVTVHSDLTISYYRWNSFPDGEGNPYQIRQDKQKILQSIDLSTSLEILQKRLSNQSKIKLYERSSSFKRSTLTLEFPIQTTTISPAPSPKQSLFTVFTKRMGGSNSKINSEADSNLLNRDELSRSINFFKDIDVNQVNNSSVTNKSLNRQHIALVLDDSGYSRIISCGYWDHSLKVHNLETLRDVGSISHPHLGQITCLQVGQQSDGITVITGGEDGTCRVWIVENLALANSYVQGTNSMFDKEIESNSTEAILQCINVLWGHSTSVTTLSYASDLDVVLSASVSGLLCVHTVRQGIYLRSIKVTLGQNVLSVLVTSAGYMIVYSITLNNEFLLHLFWINGEHLKTVNLSVGIESMAVNGSGNILVCGLSNGIISFKSLWNLEEVHTIQTLNSHGAIKSLKFTEDLQFLLIGSEDGLFSIATDPERKWKMLHAAIQKTPLAL